MVRVGYEELYKACPVPTGDVRWVGERKGMSSYIRHALYQQVM